MEKFEECRNKALKNLKIADHIASVTFPLIKDPKLFTTCLENLFLSLTNAMAAILYYEQNYKRVPMFKDDYDNKIMLIATHSSRLLISQEILNFIRKIKMLVVARRTSSMAFVRKDKFIMYSDPTDIKSISHPEINTYIAKTKLFIHLMDNIVKNARLLRNS